MQGLRRVLRSEVEGSFGDALPGSGARPSKLGSRTSKQAGAGGEARLALRRSLKLALDCSINSILHVISINRLHFPSSIPTAIQWPDLLDVYFSVGTWQTWRHETIRNTAWASVGRHHGAVVWMWHFSYRAASCRFESQPSFIAAQLSQCYVDPALAISPISLSHLTPHSKPGTG
ncbi:hypothetical protein N431DRAFT_41002 [Stipitochalara longipes BDJ]|nr:hypothetical protein N431DRAFT_41002 [Stipitochalara longipes BDJ]